MHLVKFLKKKFQKEQIDSLKLTLEERDKQIEKDKSALKELEDLDLDITLNYENKQLDVDVDVGVLFDELSQITQDQIMQAIDEAYMKFDSYIDDNFRV